MRAGQENFLAENINVDHVAILIRVVGFFVGWVVKMVEVWGCAGVGLRLRVQTRICVLENHAIRVAAVK